MEWVLKEAVTLEEAEKGTATGKVIANAMATKGDKFLFIANCPSEDFLEEDS